MRTRLLLLSALLLVPAAVRAQVPPEKALSTFTVSEGLELTLWASEPLFTNPTCMDIDHKGRVWVCESVNYRYTLHKRPPNRPEGDRIVILEDSDGDGKADKATTFYQSPELLAPLGIAVAPDPAGPGCKVYVCQSPDILLFEDKDGDGKADGPPKKLLSGFRGIDHDHGVHGILIGPDGKLYFSVGDQGVDGLVDKNGKKWKSNDTDCRAGTVWRCDLDGKNLELIAHNFRNEYEPCVDSFGTVFVSDNDDDGNQQTRICYVMPGGNYGYHPRGPGQTHWHEEQPGVVPKILRTYFGSPTGICVYEGTLLPEKYRGQLLHTDAGPRHLRCYHLKANGAGYDVDREDMVQSTDNWFRPCDVCVAPDGSVFVADWYDPGVGGHGMGDTTRGRVFHVTTKGNKPSVPKVDLESKDGILAALGSPNLAVRSMAMARLQALGRDKATPILEAALRQKENPVLRARALWQVGRLQVAGSNYMLLDAWNDKDQRFRVLAVRILKDFFGETPDRFISHANTNWSQDVLKDPSPAVLREALLALRQAEPAKAKGYLLDLIKRYDGKDRFYLEAIGIAVTQDKARRDVLLADFDKTFPEWNDKVAELVWELRPPSVLPHLGERLTDGLLTEAQRGRVVDILAASDDPETGKVLLKTLQAGTTQEPRRRILENLKLFLPGKWQALRKSPELKETIQGLLAKPETQREALALIGAAEYTDAVPRVIELARMKDDVQIMYPAIETLGLLPVPEAVAALNELALTLPTQNAVAALGKQLQHKPEGPTNAAALKGLGAVLVTLTDDSRPTYFKRHAVLDAMIGTRAGTVWLLEKAEKQELPEAVAGDAVALLRNSPYQDLRAKALVAFPPAGKLDPNKLPSIAAMAARRGDAAKGKELLAASTKNDIACLKCHLVRGAGGMVGPDLSMIGKKASRENLLESILLPSKAIADQYVTWKIDTKKGLSLSGLLIEETPDFVVLRDANGKDTRIDKKEIDERAKGPNSIMPNDLLVYMTEDDLLNMVEYLLTLKTASLTLDSWHIAGPFNNGPDDAGLDQVFPPEKAIDLKATYPGKAGTVAWRTVKPNAQGYVDLQAFLAPDSRQVVSYLFREVDSPADQEAVVLLGTDDGAKLWVNGELVFTSRAHRAAAPEQDSVKVKLKKGRNPVLLKIVNGDGPHGFYLTIQAEQELKKADGD